MKSAHDLLKELTQVQPLLFENEQIFTLYIPALVSANVLELVSERPSEEGGKTNTFTLRVVEECRKKPIGYHIDKDNVVDITKPYEFSITFEQVEGNENVLFMRQWLKATKSGDKQRLERLSL